MLFCMQQVYASLLALCCMFLACGHYYHSRVGWWFQGFRYIFWQVYVVMTLRVDRTPVRVSSKMVCSNMRCTHGPLNARVMIFRWSLGCHFLCKINYIGWLLYIPQVWAKSHLLYIPFMFPNQISRRCSDYPGLSLWHWTAGTREGVGGGQSYHPTISFGGCTVFRMSS